MWNEKKAVPFTRHHWIKNRDPEPLMKESRLGRSVYFRRGLSVDDPPNDSQRILNHIQSDDPGGGKLFATIYEWGFGDVFFLGAGMDRDIRASQYRISKLQSKLSEMIDQLDSIKNARDDLRSKDLARFDSSVMDNKDRRLLAEEAYRKSEAALADALKKEHDPHSMSSKEISDVSKDILRTQECLNFKGANLRKKCAVFVSARDVTLKSTFNIGSVAESDKIGPKTKSLLSVFSHGRFTSHDLKHRSQLLGTCLVKGTEPFSTAVCASCGKCIRNQGRSKVYHCSNPFCRAKHDRDEGGAKGIALIKIAGFFHRDDEEEEDDVIADSADDDVSADTLELTLDTANQCWTK
jgi:hypothetical protein